MLTLRLRLPGWFGSIGAAGVSLALAASPLHAQTDGTWIAPSPGPWSNAANWLDGEIPNGIGHTATVDGSLTAGGILSINIPVTLGVLNLDTTKPLFVFASGGGSLAFNNGANPAELNVSAGSQDISSPIAITGGLLVNSNSSVDVLEFVGAISGTGGLTTAGSQQTILRALNTFTGGTTVTGPGGLVINTTGSLVGTGTVTVAPGSYLQVAEQAGATASTSSVSLNSVILSEGAALRVSANLVVGNFFNAASTGGTVELGINNTQAMNLAAVDGGTGDGSKILLTTFGGSRTVSGAISLAPASPDKTLRLTSADGTTLTISSVISAANHIDSVDVVGGSVALSNLNTHTGGTAVSAGTLTINGVGSLVGTGNVTIAPGAALVVSEAAGAVAANHSVSSHSVILADGATLRLNADVAVGDFLHSASDGGTIELNANITQPIDLSTLAGGDTPTLQANGSRTISGTISFGAASPDKTVRLASSGGTLTVSSDLTSANNVENLILEYGDVVLTGNNSYSGFTHINGGTYTIATPTILAGGDGTDATAIELFNDASIAFLGHLGTSNRKIAVEHGSITYKISQGSSLVQAAPIAIQGPTSTIDVQDYFELEVAGGITSAGDVVLTNRGVFLLNDAPWSHTGNLQIHQNRTEQLELNADVNVSQTLTFGGDGTGNIDVSGTVTADAVKLDGSLIAGDGAIVSTGSSTLAIRRGDLVFDGTLSGFDAIVKTSVNRSNAIRIGDSATPLDLTIERGIITLNDTTQNVGPTVEVTGEKDTALEVDGTVTQNVNLNNGSGFGYRGAITGRGTTGGAIHGDVHLGDIGAYVGGGWSGLTIAGRVTGGFLYSSESQGLLLTGELAYTGDTLAGLDGRGQVGITVSDDATGTLGGDLYVRPGAVIATPVDRIGANASANLLGGRLRVTGFGSVNEVNLLAGRSELYVVQGALVTLDSLTHAPGASLRINAGDFAVGGTNYANGHLFLDTLPTLDDGIYAGWASVHESNGGQNDFATYDPVHGFERYVPAVRPGQVEGAGATDNVRTNAPQPTLTANTAVNSLVLASSAHNLDLGGHRLTIESGGLIGLNLPTIANGTLTAGESADDAMLYVLGAVNVSAAITDNAHGGSVGLYIGSDVTLSTANSYTGPTVVTNSALGSSLQADAMLRINTPDALPAGTDLTLVSGRLATAYVATEALQIGTLSLRDGSYIEPALAVDDWTAWIDADAYALESGTIGATYTGDGPMTKSTPGTVTLRGDAGGYTGSILVEDGILNVVTSALGSTQVTVTGGRFIGLNSNFSNAKVIAADITLDGGDLGISTTGHVHIKQDAKLLAFDVVYVPRDSIHEDPIAMFCAFTGGVTIDSGVTVEIDGHGGIVIDGNLTVGAGTTLAQLDPGAASSVNGIVHSAATNASIDFVGFAPGSVDVTPIAGTGQSLTIFFDGVAPMFAIAGGQTLAGGGSYGNAFNVSNGGILAPGSSPGTLTALADFTFGGGGVYTWELDNAVGMPGVNGDFLNVLGTLAVAATEQNPFVIQLASLDALGDAGDAANFDPLAKYSWLVAMGDELVGFDPALFELDLTAFTNDLDPSTTFELVAVDGRLYIDVNGGWIKQADDFISQFPNNLTSSVPEPGSALLLAGATLALARRRRHGRSSGG